MTGKQWPRKPPRRLRDDLQCTHNGVYGLPILAKCCEVEFSGKCGNYIDVFDDVLQPFLDLEGINGVAQNAGP